MSTLRARFASAYESVAQARRSVGGFARSCGFDHAEISDIVLAVGEAGSNAVEHGHVPNGEFHVMCDFDGRLLRIEVLDNGHGFDMTAPPSAPATEDWVGRGRGLTIMRALMDAVAYRRTSDGMAIILEKRMLSDGGAEPAGKARGINARHSSQPR